MSRSIKVNFPNSINFDQLNPFPGTQTATFSINVITPLYGGGVEASKPDIENPIRSSEIRGNLRFWWRTIFGGRYATTREMLLHEQQVWGATDMPRVNVGVSVKQINGWRNPQDYNRNSSEGYALHALFSSDSNLLREGIIFETSICWPDDDRLRMLTVLENEQRKVAKKPPLPDLFQDVGKDIEAAVWAWTNFGGIGSRTRRGLGALWCRELAPPDATLAEISKWYKEALKNYGIIQTTGRTFSTIWKPPLVRTSATNPMAAWAESIGLMRTFRQAGEGRTGQGRSYWPEAETLRRIGNSRSRHHARQEEIPDDAFPRAELGLPIIFQFKNTEVATSQLYPKGKKRMASPIILRPLQVEKGHKAVGMVLHLASALPKNLELQIDGQKQEFSENYLRGERLIDYPNSPMSSRSQTGSALETFLNYAKEKGFKALTL